MNLGRDARGQLPAAVTSFVGRQEEITQLTALIAACRLVCVVGPGGAGKTRLLLETLRRAADDTPVTFVALEPVRTAPQLATEVAAALGVRDPSQVYSIATVRSELGSAPRRLVLDAAEHLLPDVHALVARLLEAAPQLRIVVTSRRPLGLAGEVAWTVPELSCWTAPAVPGGAPVGDAVELFMQRARERNPHWSADPGVVAELCRRAGGLPLAIELIAGWTAHRSLAEIADERFADLAAGAAMGGVLERSWELLTPENREVLAGLAVFAAPFALADAQAVVTAHLPADHLVDELVAAAWLTVQRQGDQLRYAMPETMRAFVRDQQALRGTVSAARERHARHFAAVALASEQGLASAELAAWIARLEVIDADLQAALRWAVDGHEADLALDLVVPLWRWWLTSGQIVTGRQWLDAVLRLVAGRADLNVGLALRAAAVLAAENGEPAHAARLAEQALAILEREGEAAHAALAATVLGSALRYLGYTADAREHFQTALRLRRQLGDLRGEAAALNNLALLGLDSADLDTAGELLEQALTIKRQLGEPRAMALGMCNLSEVYVRTDRLDEAERTIREATALADSLGDRQLSGGLLCNLGDLEGRRGNWERAASLYQNAIAQHGEAGNEHDVIVAVVGLGRALHHLGRTGEALLQLRRAESMAEAASNMQRLASVRVALAEITGPPRRESLPDGLTPRQAEVLAHVAAGLSNKEIARNLHLSVATVERHLATIYRTHRLRGRVDAARFAADHGLLTSA